MSYEWATVSAHLAGLDINAVMPDGSIRALTIHDDEDVRDAVDIRQLPLLEPDFTRLLVVDTIQRNSFGSGATAKQTLYYDLPYVLYYLPVGADRSLAKITKNLKETASRIGAGIIANDVLAASTSIVDLFIRSMDIGQATVPDLSGNQFHGARLIIRVVEFVN